MTFAAGSVTVAAGRVSSADYADDTVRVIVSDGCALKLYVYDTAVGDGRHAGDADDSAHRTILTTDINAEKREKAD